MPNLTVRIEFSAAAEPLVSWCVNQVHPIIDAVTAANGIATFEIFGGGCIDPALFGGPFVARVIALDAANTVLAANVGVNSPDAVNLLGQTPTQSGTNTCDLNFASGNDGLGTSSSGKYCWPLTHGSRSPNISRGPGVPGPSTEGA